MKTNLKRSFSVNFFKNPELFLSESGLKEWSESGSVPLERRRISVTDTNHRPVISAGETLPPETE